MTNDFFQSLPPHVVSAVKDINLKIDSKNCLEAINNLLGSTVLQGGKRLRPLLTHLVAELFSLNHKIVEPYSRAVELVHAASLSHDDVIDNATVRRGFPSINIASSNKKAVLAGDTLLSMVIVDLCRAQNLRLVEEMSFVIRDLSEGEWIQSDLIISRDYTEKNIREIALKKTSSVMSYCCLAPAVLSGAKEEIIQKAKSFGESLGLAFQMIDDTLDYSGESLKDQMLDIQNGIVNTVVFDHLQKNPVLFEKFKNGEDLSKLINIEALTPSIKSIHDRAHGELEKAALLLNEIYSYLNSELQLNKKESDLLPLQTVISFIGLRTV